MATSNMWDLPVEAALDQRKQPVPPVLVRRSPPSPRSGGTAVAPDWKVSATGRDRVVLDEVLSLLRSARQVVVFGSFLLSDSEVQRELLAAASRGCRVYGLISAEAKLDRDVSDEDVFDAKTAEAHKRMLDEFAGRMVIRSSPSFHAKCVLVDPGTDAARGLLLTANLTTEALTRNEELAVRLNATESRVLFGQIRYAIWELAERELLGKGELDRIKPLGEVALPAADAVIHTTMAGRCHIKDAMLTMIRTAKQRIVVSSYGWDADHPVVEALCERAAKGVAVTALARYRSVATSAMLKMRRAGVELVCLPWLHAKAIVCDQDSMIMSANLQRHGLDDGFELGVRLDQTGTRELVGLLDEWKGAAAWRLESPATLGDVSGDVVFLGPGAPPKNLDGIVSIKPVVEVALDDVVADCAVRLDEARHNETVLRREAEKRGLRWTHSIRFTYRVRAPRLPANAKLETNAKDEKSQVDGAPRVFRLSDGSRVVGVTVPGERDAARALANSLGLKRVLVAETSS